MSIVSAVLVFVPAAAWAQQTSGIAGVARDTSGAVLPGITVEAASPALIEKVRTAVTDGEGRYSIVDLRPGDYSVTFTLPGFRTVKRDGIVLTGGFTATVNADMQVGALEETITVTGAAPLVDTQNVRRQNVVSDELLETLPTSNKHFNTLTTLTPGMTGGVDVAGVYQQAGTFHGKAGTKLQFDGMGVQTAHGTGNTSYQLNAATVEEMTLQSSGISAEGNADGAVLNVIPREGSNQFKGSLSGLYTNKDMQADNLTDSLRARGLDSVNRILSIYDATGTLGGPILKDRLWFFTAHREWGNGIQNAGIYWNKTQGTPFYTPDLDRPADRFQWYESHAARISWQATQRNKVNVFVDVQDVCVCRSSQLNTAPEAMFAYHIRPLGLYQGSWTSPLTSRLLIDAGAGMLVAHFPAYRQPGVEPNTISIADQGTGLTYNARATYTGDASGYGEPQFANRYSQRASVAYVTGSHAIKVGFQMEEGDVDLGTIVNGDVNYRFNNMVPNLITQYATPYRELGTWAERGFYAQDQWAVKRLTLNYGVRFDLFSGNVPAQSIPAPASGWVPAREFAEVKDVPLWRDINPRLGAAYDLFGNGRTALKFSIGRYVSKQAVTIVSANNPINASINTVTRTWTDTDVDYVPDCDLGNRAANGECGAMSDQNFGGLRVVTQWADEALRGWGARDYNWDMTTEVSHQLGTGLSVTAGYYRNWYGSFKATDNTLVTGADYSPFCVTAPSNQQLPGGGGYQVCGLYDISLERFGRVANVITQSSTFGEQKRISDFFNVGFTSQLGARTRLGGGVDLGRTVNDTCFVIDSPQQLLNCREVTPFEGQTQVKLNGSYALPFDFVVSGVFQNLSGPPILANFAATNDSIRPTLGRNLAACGTRTPCTATATAPLIVPGTQYEDRTTRLDLRLTKNVRFSSRVRLQGNFDLYNVFNASSILSRVNDYGPRWGRPLEILEGRIIQFGAQLNF